MKITDLILTPISIKIKGGGNPHTWGIQRGTSANILQIFTDEGIVGIGEPLESYVPLNALIIEKDFKPLLIGEDPTNIEPLMEKLKGLTGARWMLRTFVGALSGIEMALWDILGKATDKSVSTLLGGRFREKVEWAALEWLYSPEEMARRTKKKVEQGFNTIKLRVGLDPKQDIKNVAAVREAVGPDIKLRLDANQAWTPGFAVKMINELSKFNIEYIEQPIMLEDVMGLAQIRKKVDVPIAINEGAWTLFEVLNAIKMEACDVIMVDPHNAGGLLETKKIAAIAEAAGIPVVTHASGEFGIAFTACMHVIASSTNFLYANDEGYLRHEDDIIKSKIEFKNGFTKVPDGPGLGIEIDQDKLNHYHEEYIKDGAYFFVNKDGYQGIVPKAPRF